ncbi:MAG TPA: enoyl-CoA hydratase-related protein [Bacteroidota bacterium]|nr:enoyl-CoA hydratase-related protein [Bacteroidota bacterium]
MIQDLVSLTYRLEGRTAIITLNKPESLNALDAGMIGELGTLITWITSYEDARVIVITGAGKAFAAGADIKRMRLMSPEEARVYSTLGNSIFNEIAECRLPVIAAVNGFALGGGLELMLSCDIAIASSQAKFGFPEVTLGLIPGFGGCRRSIARIGIVRARELIYTGRIIGAEAALALGLVDRVAEPSALIETVMTIADEMCGASPNALASAKRLLNICVEAGRETVMPIEIEQFSAVFAHPDARTGLEAFIAKTKPLWKNT